ncbi:MAG: hypothetical protein INR62_13740, partial [Rhodospirillales bacterium]|nr:hypothetical protein [Acetobacter sp.]
MERSYLKRTGADVFPDVRVHLSTFFLLYFSMADITMPKLSDTMTEGTLVAWKKKAGDTVSSG